MISYSCKEKGRNHNMIFVYLKVDNNGKEEDRGVASLTDIALQVEQLIKDGCTDEIRVSNVKYSTYISVENGEVFVHQKFKKTQKYAWVSVGTFITLMVDKLFK